MNEMFSLVVLNQYKGSPGTLLEDATVVPPAAIAVIITATKAIRIGLAKGILKNRGARRFLDAAPSANACVRRLRPRALASGLYEVECAT